MNLARFDLQVDVVIGNNSWKSLGDSLRLQDGLSALYPNELFMHPHPPGTEGMSVSHAPASRGLTGCEAPTYESFPLQNGSLLPNMVISQCERRRLPDCVLLQD